MSGDYVSDFRGTTLYPPPNNHQTRCAFYTAYTKTGYFRLFQACPFLRRRARRNLFSVRRENVHFNVDAYIQTYASCPKHIVVKLTDERNRLNSFHRKGGRACFNERRRRGCLAAETVCRCAQAIWALSEQRHRQHYFGELTKRRPKHHIATDGFSKTLYTRISSLTVEQDYSLRVARLPVA